MAWTSAWARGALIWGIAGVVAAASSCSSLPDIERDTCGNGVVEPAHNEDCDDGVTDDAGRPTCYPAGSAAACHFDCSTTECPTGFSCGNDAVCRKPAGIFKDNGRPIQIDADHLLVGDFDHDGLGDVVAQTQVQMNVLFGDNAGNLSEPFTVRAPSSNPTVGLLALDPDGGTSEPYSDLIFSAADGVTTWRGRQDRTLAPTPYPSLQIGDQESRVIEVRTVSATDDVLVLTPLNQPGTGVTEPGSVLVEIGTNEGPDKSAVFAEFKDDGALPSKLVGNVAVANLYDHADSPCSEMVLGWSSVGFRDHVTVVTPCSSPTTLNILSVSGGTAAIPPRDLVLPSGPELVEVIRPNGFGPSIGDVNGDGHMDIIVNTLATVQTDAGPQSFEVSAIAYNIGDGNFSSSFTLAAADNAFSTGVPGSILAMGQLTSVTDKYVDFVTPFGIVLEAPLTGDVLPDGGGAGAPQETDIDAPQEWIDARIADIDGDGFLDVVAGAPGRIDIYRASGTDNVQMTGLHYTVDGSASQFAVGDFDGDRAPDIAFRAARSDGTSDLDVMWGHFRGVPDDPVVIGRFGNIRTIGTGVIFGDLGNSDSVGDLGVVVEGAPEAGTDAGPFSVSVLAGATNRQLQAPFLLEKPSIVKGTSDIVFPLAFSVGQLTQNDRHFDMVSGVLEERLLDAGVNSDAGIVADIQIALAQSTGAAQLSSDPARLKFTNTIDTFAASTSCSSASCNLPIADWAQLSLVTVDLDGPGGATVGNGVDEIVGVAPALFANGAFQNAASALHDASADGVIFWARLDGTDWKVQSVAPLGSLPSSGGPGFAQIATADVNGDGADDVLVLVDGKKSTSLLVYMNQRDGQLTSKPTAIALPAYSTDPGDPFHIVSFAAIDADNEPGKEIAVLTDKGGLFLAKSNASGDSFTLSGPLCDGAPTETCANNSRSRISSGQALAAIDVDGDGIQDLLLETNLTLHVYKGLAVDP